MSKITRDFGELAYYKTGQGPVLLGLSGFTCSHYNFIDLAPHLEKHFTLVLIDNRATGKSSGTHSDYSMKNLAEDALAVMDHLGVGQFGLMGISMGGFIAQELIKLAPNRVSALCLMCTTSGPPSFDHPKKLTENDLRQMALWEPKAFAVAMTNATVHPTLIKNNPDQYQRIINLRLENPMDLEEKIRQNKAAVNFLETPYDLTAIKCPVLAMAGSDDRFLSSTFPSVFKNVIPHAEAVLIEESDHYFFLEKPELVASKLNQFFQGKVS